ncbi:hypothetical protein, conserved [Eimeria necatrix]|uniref:SSD domain-containing protein n=1 Tax=Eimeria necatrix TaxID=51315 RepID=U6MLU8_9EIME|nr:hypothetical protein, conserved [Eimeria necatrix]CDJ64023.1 hypothetical protein, conserved [Eimeria necatrix]
MCNLLGACCGGAKRAFRCCSLRTFAFIWLGISVILALVQFVAGAYLTSYLGPVDSLLEDIRDRIMTLDDPTTALKYYNVISGSLAVLWKTMTLLTTVRGVFDTVAVICWGVGFYRRKIMLLYVFIGMMAVDFFLDFCLFIILMIVVNALYIAFFFPSALALPFVLYGWEALLGPYVLHLLLSHAFVMSVGGDGTEMKSWKEVKELQEKGTAKEKQGKSEEARLLGDSSGEGKVLDGGTDADDEDTIAVAQQEV